MHNRHAAPPTSQETRLPGFSGLTVSVVVEPESEGQLLVRELQRLRCIVTRAWPMPDRLPDNVDVIFSVFSESLHERLPWMPGEPTAALVILLPQHGGYDLKMLSNCGPDAVLFRPWQSHQIVTAFEIARSQFLYIKRLRSRIERLDENIRAARDIERAKTILAQTRSMSDKEAYAFLRSQAMERRVSVAALASAFVDSYALVN